MSKIYEALQKAQAEREGLDDADAPRSRRPRRSWWRGRQTKAADGDRRTEPLRIDFDLAPEVEEAYQRLGTNLLIPARATTVIRDLMFIASEHGEGATTTAALFASTLAKRKKLDVLLIEANMRTPALEQVFPITRNGGFAELIEDRQDEEKVIQGTAQPHLFVMTSGHYETSPSHVLESARLPDVMARLHERFQFVVFDAPPVNIYTDGLILGSQADATVFVLEADQTRVEEAQRAKRQLERAGAKLLGALLNRRKKYVPDFLDGLL